MKPVRDTIRKTFYKGVLFRQPREHLLCLRITGNKLRHFHRKLIGKAHNCQKLPLFLWERINHGRSKCGINI